MAKTPKTTRNANQNATRILKEKVFLNVPEAAEFLGLPESTFRKLVAKRFGGYRLLSSGSGLFSRGICLNGGLKNSYYPKRIFEAECLSENINEPGFCCLLIGKGLYWYE